ncbi:fructose-bisphosphate aldolase, class II [Stipitochalara longipes BDJ]|nr:fructose-bisphosphate aldolase, class II [Stipitochalara longipes BDJ]
MGLSNLLSRKSGVVVGGDVLKLFEYARDNHFAIPAINVASSSAIIAALEAARNRNAPIILEISHTDAVFFAGLGITDSATEKIAIHGSIAAAQFIRAVAPLYDIPVILHTDHCRTEELGWLDGMLDMDEAYFESNGEPLFSSHMIDLSSENKAANIAVTTQYFKRMASLNLWLEMEIGVVREAKHTNDYSPKDPSLYTQPRDVYDVYAALSPISQCFSVAVGFGNTHGIYKSGTVQLIPSLLGDYQSHVQEKIGAVSRKPVFLVFHGGSGSSIEEFKEAIEYGVTKVNINADTQFAMMTGIKAFMFEKKDYLATRIGNPEGPDEPNKKFYDTRFWVREGEKKMVECVEGYLDCLGTSGRL